MFFSVFDEPLQSFKRKIAHNHRDEPDLCQHITDNLGFVGFGWVQYGVLLEEVAWIKKNMYRWMVSESYALKK